MLFLYLNGLPDPAKPRLFLVALQHMRAIISPVSGRLEDEFVSQLGKMLRAQYGYEIGPHRHILLKSPPVLLDWPDKRPSSFYEYADTVPYSGVFHSKSFTSVYVAYGHFLDSIDLEKIAGANASSWPSYIKQLQIYRKMVEDSNGSESEKAKALRADIEKIVSEADKAEEHSRKARKSEAERLYTHAYLRYSNIAFKTNVVDSSGTAWLRASYTMDPPLNIWLDSVPAFQPELIGGNANIDFKQSGASDQTAEQAAPSSLQGTAYATLQFKRIGKIDISPGQWFDPYIVRYFAKGPFRNGTDPWGPDSEFPSMPIALVVAQEPSVALDLSGIQEQVKGATVTSVGPIQFEKSDVKVEAANGKTILVHNTRSVYLIAVVTVDMPYVQ